MVHRIDAKQLYLGTVALIGFGLLLRGLHELADYTLFPIFPLLAILAAAAAIATTSMSVSEEAGITYEVFNAIAIAAVPLFGPLAATVPVTIGILFAWIAKPADKTTWKKSTEQLGFNAGMANIAISLSGIAFALSRHWLGPNTIAGETIPWGIAAIIYGQVNAVLLIGILYLQHGRKIDPIKIWRENRWYMVLDAILMSAGGALLAFAAREYGWFGVIIFFLPIILSTLAFRLYVRQMEEHMANLEEIVEERTQKLRAANEEKDAFLAVLTHDMKTPLTSIGLYADMLQDRPEAIIENPEMTDIIVRNQQVLLDIVNNILDLERLESGGSLPMQKDEFELVTLVKVLAATMRPQAEDKQIQLTTHLPAPPLIVYADAGQIERVLMNLVSNAIKYTPEKGAVAISVEREGENVVFRVSDTGYGIPDDQLEYIFERYRRVREHEDKATGTGLGLSVTQALVGAHGGEVTVESKEGDGSTFTVRLPIIRYS